MITIMLYKEMKYLERVAINIKHYYNPYDKIKTKIDNELYTVDTVVHTENKFISSIIVDNNCLNYMIDKVKVNKSLVYEKDGTLYGNIINIEPTIEERTYIAFLEGKSIHINKTDIERIESNVNKINELSKNKYTKEDLVIEKNNARNEMKNILKEKIERSLNQEISKYGNIFISSKKTLNKMKDSILESVFI
jgi:hypothetical protein